MNSCSFIIILIWSALDLVICITVKRSNETIQSLNKRSGEPIANDNLIQIYEREHQKLYNEETGGIILKWPDLDQKNLSNYCRMYLQHSVPRRTNDDVIGTNTVRELVYLKENKSITSKIVVVQCKVVLQLNTARFHYMTRASKPNCVYALDRRKDDKLCHRFNIINKHCDFEEKPLIIRSLKQRKIEIISTVNAKTGQPIAKDKYLLQYELEHRDMLNKEGKEGKYIEWPWAVSHYNLDSYCYKYVRELVPHRNREGIRGILKTEKLYYQKLNTNGRVHVTTVTCVTTNASKWHYHMTRAPEINCVYALLRQGHNIRDPLVIVFKHCDFEELIGVRAILQNNYIIDKVVTPKIEVKEELLDATAILELFPND